MQKVVVHSVRSVCSMSRISLKDSYGGTGKAWAANARRGEESRSARDAAWSGGVMPRESAAGPVGHVPVSGQGHSQYEGETVLYGRCQPVATSAKTPDAAWVGGRRRFPQPFPFEGWGFRSSALDYEEVETANPRA